jgi:excisionase family DNA binding protein
MQLHTIRDAASILCVSKSTMYSLVHSGRISFVSVGGKKGYRFTESDLQDFINANRQVFRSKPKLPKRQPYKHLKLN